MAPVPRATDATGSRCTPRDRCAWPRAVSGVLHRRPRTEPSGHGGAHVGGVTRVHRDRRPAFSHRARRPPWVDRNRAAAGGNLARRVWLCRALDDRRLTARQPTPRRGLTLLGVVCDADQALHLSLI